MLNRAKTMCFTMFLLYFHDFHYLIMKCMIMMHHHHHFQIMSSLFSTSSAHVIIIYHLHVIMMHHLHHFRNMSSLIFNIFSTCYHQLSFSCDYDASYLSFLEHVITNLKQLRTCYHHLSSSCSSWLISFVVLLCVWVVVSYNSFHLYSYPIQFSL